MSNPVGAQRYGLGGGDAYYDAVKYGGYTGTREQFGRDQAEFAQNATAVAQAKEEVERNTQTVVNTAQTFTEETVPAAIQSVEEKGDTEEDRLEARTTELVQSINTAGAVQVQAVEDEGTEQIRLVSGAGTAQVEAVEQAGSDQVDAVEAAGSTQVGNVNNAGSTQISAVNSEGSTQVQVVQDKGTEVLNSIPSDYTELTEDVDNLKTTIMQGNYKNPSARIVSDSVAPSTRPSINLLNPDDPDFAEGKLITGTTGAISDNAYYNTTGFIPVTEGQKIAFTVYYNNTTANSGNRRSMRTVVAYDSSKNIVPSAGINADTMIYTVPSGVSFIRFSSNVRAWTDYTYYMVWDCHSTDSEYTIVDYQPYGNVYADGKLTISSFPRFLKYGLEISFTAKINSFGSDDHIYIGWIDDTPMYQGYWEITSTSIILHVGVNTTLTTLTHELTLSDYISCVITVHSDIPNFSVVLNTKGGTFSAEQTGETTRTLLCGIPTLATNATLTNVVLSVSTSQAKNKVWIFGDSYIGYGSDRILGNLFSWGFTENILVDALGGMDSTGAYQELNRLLTYGTPSVIVWMLGMNDNSEDLSIYNTLAEYCDSNNITLILNKCPVVPSRISENTAQNSAVIATGKRYVDSYEAVGCDGTGGWYDGMLSSNNIHPTSTGSMAIASRMLIDAPEIAPN